MKITLYQCPCKVNDVNKIKHSTKVLEVEAEVYGDFYLSNASFTLSQKVRSNYCTYESFGLKFCGWTSVHTNAKGLYTYNIKEDIIEMAWENGSFNAEAMCLYSSLGDSLIPDNRIMREPQSKLLSYTISDLPTLNGIAQPTGTQSYHDYYVALVISTSSEAMRDSIKKVSDGSIRPNLYNIPGQTIYLLRPIDFIYFYIGLRSSTDTVQAEYTKSILGIYLVKESWVSKLWWVNTTSDGIYLYKFNVSEDATAHRHKVPFQTSNNAQSVIECNYRVLSTASDNSLEIVSDPITVATNLSMRGDLAEGYFTMKINNGPMIQFSLDSLLANTSQKITTITSLGYAVTPNILGGTLVFYPVINGVICKHMEAQYQLSNMIQITTDDSYISNQTKFTTLASIVGGIASMFVGGTAVGAVMSAQKVSAAVKATTASAITSGISPATTGIFGLVGAQAAANQGAAQTAGGLGQDYSLPRNSPTRIWISYVPYIDYTKFSNMYGKPDGHIRNLSTLTGYVLTSNVRLASPNGAMSVGIRPIDETLNGSGVFILS